MSFMETQLSVHVFVGEWRGGVKENHSEVSGSHRRKCHCQVGLNPCCAGILKKYSFYFFLLFPLFLKVKIKHKIKSLKSKPTLNLYLEFDEQNEEFHSGFGLRSFFKNAILSSTFSVAVLHLKSKVKV